MPHDISHITLHVYIYDNQLVFDVHQGLACFFYGEKSYTDSGMSLMLAGVYPRC
jgi:hypothetical protein